MKKGRMVSEHIHTAEQYKEWSLLLAEAKKMGLQPDEIRAFFRKYEKNSKKR